MTLRKDWPDGGMNLKDLYSIGETAKLLGVSVQTLQYYDKVGLMKPAYVNAATGYRYYKFNQFQFIDRVKYLQRLGLSLDEIRLGLQDGTSECLIPILEEKRVVLERELSEAKEKLENLEWYINYFNYLKKLHENSDVYISRIAARYALSVPHYEQGISVAAELRMAKAKSDPDMKSLKYQRQYGYILDYDKLCQDVFQATSYFIYLREKPMLESDALISFPAGEYLCFSAQVNDKNWDHTAYLEYFQGKSVPELIIAEEFEDDLENFDDSWYEIQVLINPIGK